MIASKVICNTTYNNKSWFTVAQGIFNLREINQMEREMCLYLDWDLTVDNTILTNFTAMVVCDFRGQGPYPMYSLQMVSTKAIALNPSITASSTSISRATAGCDTPSSCSSTLTSLASSASPTTPPGIVDNSAQIAGSPPSIAMQRHRHVHSTFEHTLSPGTLSILTEKPPVVHPLKGKMYANAIPSVW
jgi:hypothetical protein